MIIASLKNTVFSQVFDSSKNDTENEYLVSNGKKYWKVSKAIYAVSLSLDGNRSISQIAEFVKENFNIEITDEEVEFVIEKFFNTNGLLVNSDESVTKTHQNKKIKMLWVKFSLIPAKIVNKLSILTFLFNKYVLFIIGFILLVSLPIIWISNTNKTLINNFLYSSIDNTIIIYSYLIFSGFFHEFGHSTALKFNKAPVGNIGVGIYLIFPVFYANVTSAWILARAKRVMVDIGGIYFQSLIALLTYIIAMLVHSELLMTCVIISIMQIVSNLNPFIRMDGYWILSDSLGVTNINNEILNQYRVLFYNIIHKEKKPMSLKRTQRVFIYIYSILLLIFLIYFLFVMSVTLYNTYGIIKSDFINFSSMSVVSVDIIIKYVFSRLNTIIILLFSLRLIFSLVKMTILRKINKNN